MRYACTPILVGVTSPVSEILLLPKTTKFPFWTMGYIKKFNHLELVQKSMQVEVDVKCMHTNFGGHGLTTFGDFAHFCLPSKQPKFPFSLKNLIDRNRLKKFMQIDVDMKRMQINFGGRSLSSFRDFATFFFNQM